jgi:hypothetical protein
MKKDIKALIKRLTLFVQFKKTGKGWVSVDGGGIAYLTSDRPYFTPSGLSESLDRWDVADPRIVVELTRLDNMPLSMVCPSLPASKALFYTDGETVWLIDL